MVFYRYKTNHSPTKPMRILLYFTSLFVCLSAFAQETNYQALVIDKALTENANAVVRLDEMTIDLNAKNEMVIHRKKAVTVLNKTGNRHAMLYVGYDDGRKVKSIEAIVYNSLGEQIDKIKENKFSDASAVDGSTLYSDSRYKYYSYTPIQYPYTIECTYEVTTKNTGEIPPFWSFLADFMVSTEKSSLQINFATPDLKPEIKEINLDDVSVSKVNTLNSISFKVQKIRAIKAENLSPSFRELVPAIMIRPVNFYYKGHDAKVNDWNDLGRWMYSNLLTGRDELSEATKNKALSLVNGVTDDLEKAKIIYQYVQDNTRYISVQVGIGGIQPISAIEVDRVKYGDCKGLSNYTKALLSVVGVESFYTHVEAGRNKVDFYDDFPDLAQGNHVILAIPYDNKYYWIDCTSQVHPFGFIGDFTDGRKVLIIKPAGGEIVKTDSYENEQNYQNTTGNYSLKEDGSISGEIVIRTQGIQYDNRFGLEGKPKDEITKYYKNYWDYINNLNIESYSFDNNRSDIVFAEKLAVKAANYASKSGNRILFAPNAFNKNKYVPQRYRNRKLPLQIQRGFFDEDNVEIQIPEGYAIEAFPEGVAIENKFGTYSVNFEILDNKVIFKRKLLIKNGNYPSTEYAAYRNFMKTVAKWDNSKVVLIKS